MRNGFSLAWLPVLFLLASTAAVNAGDYDYVTNSDDTLAITKYTGSGGAVTIPSTIYGKAVTGIGYFAFSSGSKCCTRLTSVTPPASVTIPASVTSIGTWAFGSCTGLTSITVDSGNSAYSSVDGVLFDKGQATLIQCPGGKVGSYAIPDGVTSIGTSAFTKCTSLTSVTIPNSVTNIRFTAFGGCTRLTSVTIPNSVTRIGDGAFAACTNLTSVTIGKGVTSIGEQAFVRCTGLTSITVDSGNSAYSSVDGVLFDKGQATLIRCPGGKAGSYAISTSVTCIGKSAFYGCTGLTSVTIPDGVTRIGEGAFDLCTVLISVTIPNSVISIGNNAFQACTSLTNVTIPNGVTNIESGAFGTCTRLTSVTIPDGVTSIGMLAFDYCTSLTSVTIGNGVTRIGQQAFSGCTHLTGVYFKGNAPNINAGVFDYYHGDKATVYYLDGTTGWGKTFGGRPTAVWTFRTPPSGDIHLTIRHPSFPSAIETTIPYDPPSESDLKSPHRVISGGGAGSCCCGRAEGVPIAAGSNMKTISWSGGRCTFVEDVFKTSIEVNGFDYYFDVPVGKPTEKTFANGVKIMAEFKPIKSKNAESGVATNSHP